jgi:hypothetical protein
MCHASCVMCQLVGMCHEHLLLFPCGCALHECRHDECDTSRAARANRHDDPEVLPGFNTHTHAFMCHTHACMCARQLIHILGGSVNGKHVVNQLAFS